MLTPTDRVAFVGTPCQVTAVKRAQLFLKHAPEIYSKFYEEKYPQSEVLKKYENIKITIGLFCMENFYYPDFISALQKKGIRTDQIKKMKIQKNVLKVESNTKNFEISLRDTELKESILRACSICPDFASSLADISIGSTGSPQGYSTVIVRSNEGLKFFQRALKKGHIELNESVTDGEKNSILNRIRKLENVKIERANKNLRHLSNDISPHFYSKEKFDVTDSILVSLMQNFYSLNNITKNNLCTQCGICVAICPTNALEFQGSVPESTGQCDDKVCGLCFALCPHNYVDFDVDKNQIFNDLGTFANLEKIYIARSSDEKLREVSQDGGVASALIAFGIEENLIDVSIGIKNAWNSSWMPEAVYVKSKKDVIETAGSKYSACRSIKLLH